MMPDAQHHDGIGNNATLLPSITIGRNATVGAGPIVTRDVPDNVTVIGIKAKPKEEYATN